MTHACNPSIWEMGAGGLPCIPGRSPLSHCSEILFLKTQSRAKGVTQSAWLVHTDLWLSPPAPYKPDVAVSL